MEFTAFERGVLDWYLDKYEDEALRSQIRRASPTQRDYTGVGFFIDLSVNGDASPIGPELSTHLDGPFVESASLELGGGTILVSQAGRLTFLELFAYGNHFPAELPEFRLLDEPPPKSGPTPKTVGHGCLTSR